MAYRINTAAVIGSGVMGGGIAALLANAGLNVHLLDIVPPELEESEAAKGLTLDEPAVRNRIVQAGLDRIIKASPPVLFTPDFADRIRPGNLEDNLDLIGDADWVVEVIVEDLAVKQDLMALLEGICKPESIISSNTSGIPIGEIVNGRSPDYAARFLGTHFFNPPRSMKLLEIIPWEGTDAGVLDFMIAFGENVLGKGVVPCKDTPNFIANRLAWIPIWHDLEYTITQGYTVEEVDALTGPLIGRPSTATFRLQDLVGFDVSIKIAENLFEMIPHDTFRDNLMSPNAKKMRERMLENGMLGRKSGQGFYQMERSAEGRRFFGLNLETVEYREAAAVELPRIDEAAAIGDLGERLRFLVAGKDRTGDYLWATLSTCMAYAAACIPEVADDIRPIDNALKWGYAHRMGPFEMWDALGVVTTLERMENDGIHIAPWVHEMVASGVTSFYRKESDGRGFYSAVGKTIQPIPVNERIIVLNGLRADGKIVEERSDAALFDIGDGVACLELRAKTGVITDEVLEMYMLALDKVDSSFDGLVLGGDGRNFATGPDLRKLVEICNEAHESGDTSKVGEWIGKTQRLGQAYRFFHKPIVAATYGMTTAAGASQAFSASAICAHSESYIGLTETKLGLIPGGCGCKEILRRMVSPVMRTPGVDPLPFLQKAFDTLSGAAISTSAEDALRMGFITPADRIVMNRDFLIGTAKRMVLDRAVDGYQAPIKEKSIYAVGRDGLAGLRAAIHALGESGAASEHEMKVAEKLAYVLCGGELSSPQWVDEEYILDLEREAFVSLAGEAKTMERIQDMAKTGKSLSN